MSSFLRSLRPLAALALFANFTIAHAATELFFSEYVEGTSNNKAVEIVNETGASVNLAAGVYDIQLFFNGSPTAGTTIPLTGTVASADVYILAHSSAVAAVTAVADQTSSSLTFNGDDAVVLRKNGVVIDSIGQVGLDPGTEWGTGITSTADNTLRRKSTVCAGDTAATNAFDPAVEWDGFAVDTFGGLGAHSSTCGESAPSVSSTSPASGATGVAVGANIDITFNESVNFNAGAFTLECPAATAVPFTLMTASPATTVTLNPDADLSMSTTCTVTTLAASITDADANDPPDNMTANHAFNFTTVGAMPTLSIADVTLAEGNVGTTTFAFNATLDSDPGASTVTFALTAADDSATDADNDYEPATTNCSLSGTNRTCTLNVSVNGDLGVEPNETFFVNVTAVVGASAPDLQAVGTINNDDTPITAIGAVQGTGLSSPLVGSSVSVIGIVTARDTVGGSGGFWVQEAAPGDSNTATSDGIFVFGLAAANTVAIGDLVRVTGTVAEFNTLTELSSPTMSILSSGNALPAPVDLSLPANTPSPTDVLVLERIEGMRALAPSFTATATNDGNVNYTLGTGTNTSSFHGVITGTPRPFREAGIPINDAIPAPEPPPVSPQPPYAGPRWDENPELLRVNTTILTGSSLLAVRAGTELTNLVGVIDYFNRYNLLPDPASPPTVVGGSVPSGTAVAAPTTREFTIAGSNLERFENSSTSFIRMIKASRAIRDHLRSPDILGLIEVGSLTVAQNLAARISSDAIAASQPDPQYQAHLLGLGTQELAFLVKQAPVEPGVPRVEVLSVTEVGRNLHVLCPDGVAQTVGVLNDRPPLILEAIVHAPNGADYPVTVIANHLKSLIGVDDPGPADANYACFPSEGARNRAKRQQGAEYLANLVQARQIANPSERIVLLGDFNAYEFNDGYADVMGTILGNPGANDQTIVPNDGADLVEPNLEDLYATTAADQFYSYSFDGNGQILDHIIVNDDVLATTSAARIEYPRIDADFLDSDRNDAGTALRISDHEPVVGFFAADGFGTRPTINDVANQSTNEDTATSPAIGFTITDVESALNCVTSVGVAATPPTAIATASLSGTAPSCELTLTPAANFNGTVGISITVTDADGDTASDSFDLVVNPVNDAPSFTVGTNIMTNEDGGAHFVANWTANMSAGPSDETGQVLTFNVTGNTNPALFSVQPVQSTSSTLFFTLAPNAFGSATITLTLSDNGGTANGGFDTSAPQQFTIDVAAINDRPTISAIADFSTNENTAGQANFTLADIDNSLNCSSANLSATSTNTALVSNASISFSGTPGACTATLTPAASATGFTDVTITVNDGSGAGNATASETFRLTVNENDLDNDLVPDSTDNCPMTANPNQQDSNGNGVGDACEANRIFFSGFEGN